MWDEKQQLIGQQPVEPHERVRSAIAVGRPVGRRGAQSMQVMCVWERYTSACVRTCHPVCVHMRAHSPADVCARTCVRKRVHEVDLRNSCTRQRAASSHLLELDKRR